MPQLVNYGPEESRITFHTSRKTIRLAKSMLEVQARFKIYFGLGWARINKL